MNFAILQMTEDEIREQLNLELAELVLDEMPVNMAKIESITDGQCRAFVAELREHYSDLMDYRTTEEWETDLTLKVYRPFLVKIGALPNDGTYEEGP